MKLHYIFLRTHVSSLSSPSQHVGFRPLRFLLSTSGGVRQATRDTKTKLQTDHLMFIDPSLGISHSLNQQARVDRPVLSAPGVGRAGSPGRGKEGRGVEAFWGLGRLGAYAEPYAEGRGPPSPGPWALGPGPWPLAPLPAAPDSPAPHRRLGLQREPSAPAALGVIAHHFLSGQGWIPSGSGSSLLCPHHLSHINKSYSHLPDFFSPPTLPLSRAAAGSLVATSHHFTSADSRKENESSVEGERRDKSVRQETVSDPRAEQAVISQPCSVLSLVAARCISCHAPAPLDREITQQPFPPVPRKQPKKRKKEKKKNFVRFPLDPWNSGLPHSNNYRGFAKTPSGLGTVGLDIRP